MTFGKKNYLFYQVFWGQSHKNYVFSSPMARETSNFSQKWSFTLPMAQERIISYLENYVTCHVTY